MRSFGRVLVLFGLGAAGALAPGEASADPVVAFGDSWAADGADELAAALAAAGLPQLTVANAAVPGTTAEDWAVSNPMAMSNAVFSNPDAEWVWLSIGGNDVFELHQAGQGNTAAAHNDLYIRQMLDAFFTFHPDVRVVMFAYDYVNFVQSQMCRDQAAMIFYPGITQQEINQIVLRDVAAVAQTIANDYDRVTFVPLAGTLQAAGGIPNAPDVSQPSPASLMFDCFHPTSQGYRAVADALVAAYWAAPTPTVSISPQPGTACLGESVTFSAQATNTQQYRWRLNGAPLGAGTTQSITFDTVGAMTVAVEAINRAYLDVASQVINVRSCVDAGVPDTGAPDTGAPDTGAPDTGAPDTGVELDGGFVDGGDPDGGVADTGSLPDFGVRDTGVGPFDSGILPSLDAGLSKPMVAGEWSLGGGCSCAPRSRRGMDGVSGWAWLALLAFSASSSWFCRRPRLRRP